MKKVFLFVILLGLASCSQNKLDIDVSEIQVPELRFLRLEQDLFEIGNENFATKSIEMKQKYGSFFDKYLVNPLHLSGLNDTNCKNSILTFTGDPDIKAANQEVQKLYTDQVLENLSVEITNCFKRFKYHFPNKKLPSQLITCTTGWNYAFAYTDGAMVVGLDMYLGSDSKYYRMLAYPNYQVRKMNEAHLLPDIARGWMLTEFDNAEPVNTLLYHTIFYGKLFYAVNALLPNMADSLLIGYTADQIKYCKTYEKKLWGYFAEKNRLYENNLTTVRELTSEGPFTGAIHKDCPPRIAMWVGWQIVKNYMANNQEVTLADLMNETEAQKILTKSKYRP